ncbi:hypothetical protein CROQUDRAFT_100194 [Cronartium quercuum f. sp. fusiforme G11]|uniref:Uncharacterized protein n=1 Tax=Cronartium quercuum f. sp. fusiforme G11 TaxID=708437 RepID=A0A9P6T5X2_9BASI|nr:hypothetical protein CROQUDRAFT_100194 [Cronartium quercuum f. sp. fusiforme G11]
MAKDKALSPKYLHQHLHTRPDAYHLFFAWLSNIKAMPGWTNEDTTSLSTNHQQPKLGATNQHLNV